MGFYNERASAAREKMMARGLIGPSKLHSRKASKTLLLKFYNGNKYAIDILVGLGYISPNTGWYDVLKELPTIAQWDEIISMSSSDVVELCRNQHDWGRIMKGKDKPAFSAS